MRPLSPSYILGLTFIVLVAVLWSASSILTQFLYSDRYRFDSPFLLTYIGVSLFSLWLPTHGIMEWMTQATRLRTIGHDLPLVDAAGAYRDVPSQTEADIDAIQLEAESTSDEPQTRNQRPSIHATIDGATNNHQDADAVEHEVLRHATSPWTRRDHFIAAAKIAPVWFLANWTYNSSLAYTTITSSTVLASTGSLFTFGFAVATRDEDFGWIKFGGVLLGVTGSVLTALGDSSSAGNIGNETGLSNHTDYHFLARFLTSLQETDSSHQLQPSWNHSSLWGDALGLLSAVGYGAYAVQTRILCPHDESLYSMQILLGYIGLICMISLSPIAIYHVTSSSRLSLVVFGFLFVKGLFDNVISDYLWLRSVILTNATVATVGLGLTIPLAFLSDIFVVDHSSSVVSANSILGALCVLSGFVLVNIGNNDAGVHVSGSYETLDNSLVVADDDHLRGEQELSQRHDTTDLR